jgi:hypothetical protein
MLYFILFCLVALLVYTYLQREHLTITAPKSIQEQVDDLNTKYETLNKEMKKQTSAQEESGKQAAAVRASLQAIR